MDLPITEEAVIQASQIEEKKPNKELDLKQKDPSNLKIQSALIVVGVVGAALFAINAMSGQEIIQKEEQEGIGLSMWGLIGIELVGFVSLCISIFPAHLEFRKQGSYLMFWHLAGFFAIHAIWTLSVFQPDVNKGLTSITAFILLIIGLGTMVLSCMKGHFSPLFLIVFLWLLYICLYSIRVDIDF
jgi:hypothetical protein